MPKLNKILVTLMLLVLLWPVPMTRAHEVDDNLVRISLNIFPKLVAVDLDMKDKLTSDNQIRLHIFYDKKKDRAEIIADHLADKYPRIAGISTQVTLGNNLPSETPTAILLVEHLEPSALKKLVDYGIGHHRLVFSPFKEDVDRGVTAGMYMAIRILPYFNRDTLTRSQIRIHEILLRSAKFYE